MSIVRVSFMRPEAGQKGEVERLLNQLEEVFSTLPGYIMGFCWASHEEPQDEMGRITIWADLEAANAASQDDKVFALRAHLHRCVRPGHQERVLNIQGMPKNMPQPTTPT